MGARRSTLGSSAARSDRSRSAHPGAPAPCGPHQKMIDAANPECILLYVLMRGAVRIEQDERDCLLRPGDIACHDTSRPSTFEGRTAFEVLMVSLPHSFIGVRAESLARRSATKLDRGDASLARLASPFLIGLARTAREGTGCPGSRPGRCGNGPADAAERLR